MTERHSRRAPAPLVTTTATSKKLVDRNRGSAHEQERGPRDLADDNCRVSIASSSSCTTKDSHGEVTAAHSGRIKKLTTGPPRTLPRFTQKGHSVTSRVVLRWSCFSWYSARSRREALVTRSFTSPASTLVHDDDDAIETRQISSADLGVRAPARCGGATVAVNPVSSRSPSWDQRRRRSH